MTGAAERFAESALETALFLEDAFGIHLSDTEIDAAVLGTKEEVTAIVNERLGVS